MRLLVTGGAGFIGSNFIHYWLKNHPQDDVINFDLLTYAGNLESLKSVENNPKYKFIKGDIRDRDTVSKAMQGVDVVVHFAAESHVDRSIVDPEAFTTTNIIGTQVLLGEALKAKVWRFHHVSTDEVFGSLSLDKNEKFDENTPYNPKSPYSASKAAADFLVRSYGHTYKLPFTITNCSNNYGPNHFPEKFIPNLITRALTGRKLPVYGQGINVRDWLYVEDHCRAIEQVLLRGKVGETYVVGDNAEISNLEVAEKICQFMNIPVEQIEFVGDRPGHDLRYAIDASKIREELGWQPQVTFEQGLQQTINWYKNNPDWWQPLLKKAQISSQKPAVAQYNWGIPAQEEVENRQSFSNGNGIIKTVMTNPIKKNILIFGRGQLGTFYKDFYEKKGFNVVQAVRPQVDVRNYQQVLEMVKAAHPEFVINCVAITSIDYAEQHKVETFETNTLGADNIARACQETNTYLVHLSTGCMQESKTPEIFHLETDTPDPLCYYSWTKLWAEELIQDRMNRHNLWALILRPRQLVSSMVSPRNALTKMLTYRKFIDTPNSCTVVEDLLWATDELIKKNAGGIYNVANPGITSPYRIALLLKELIKPDMTVEKISKEELNRMTLATRIDSLLDTSKLAKQGIVLPEINNRLKEIVTQLKNNLVAESSRAVLGQIEKETQAKLSLVNQNYVPDF